MNSRIKGELERQLGVITEGLAEVIPADGLTTALRKALEENRPLRVKYGIDPTAPDVHVGHMVPCGLLRRFQDLGHLAVLIIGDFTAQIGDPSGRNQERPPLSAEEVEQHSASYADQIFRIVDPRMAEVHFQSEWFSSMDLKSFFQPTSRFSVAQLLAHETFRKRLDDGDRLSLHEMFYPVLQAHDSVEIRADIEIGGSDQKFNCLCGRDLMRIQGMEPQVVLTVPLLNGTDGRKMSKSFNNHIPVTANAAEMVGKVMSYPDSRMRELAVLGAGIKTKTVLHWEQEVAGGDLHPMEMKFRIAQALAALYHGTEPAHEGVEAFRRLHSQGEIPESIQSYPVPAEGIGILDLMRDAGLTESGSTARRLVEQGGVRLNDRIIDDPTTRITPEQTEQILRVGKRRFLRVVAL